MITNIPKEKTSKKIIVGHYIVFKTTLTWGHWEQWWQARLLCGHYGAQRDHVPITQKLIWSVLEKPNWDMYCPSNNKSAMKKYISFDYEGSLWSLSVSSCVEGNLLGIVNIRRDFWEKIQSLIHGKPSDRNCST